MVSDFSQNQVLFGNIEYFVPSLMEHQLYMVVGCFDTHIGGFVKVKFTISLYSDLNLAEPCSGQDEAGRKATMD